MIKVNFFQLCSNFISTLLLNVIYQFFLNNAFSVTGMLTAGDTNNSYTLYTICDGVSKKRIKNIFPVFPQNFMQMDFYRFLFK